MIIEPVMMNIGVIPPPPGYLDGARATLLHTHGALLAFDEVKTGLDDRARRRHRALRRRARHRLPRQGARRRRAVRRDRRHRRGDGLIADGTYEQVGTFNGNPLTMAAAKAMLLEVLTPAAYRHFDELREELVERARPHPRAPPPARATCSAFGAKGASCSRRCRSATTATSVDYDARYGHAHWLYQHNGGVFLPPWGKMEQWTLSVQHTADDVDAGRRATSSASPATCGRDALRRAA